MSTKANLIRKLRNSKEYRDAFVEAQIGAGIPFQILALRKRFGWSQLDLANAASMAQPRICAMEQAGYGDFTLLTLKKLAAAFDVGLVVRFASFGDMADWADTFSPDTFEVPSAKEDPQLSFASNTEGNPIAAKSAMLSTLPPQTGAVSLSARDAGVASHPNMMLSHTAFSAALQNTANTANADHHRIAA